MKRIYLLLGLLFTFSGVFSQVLTITEIVVGQTYVINGTTSGDILIATEASETIVRIRNTTLGSSNDYKTTSGFSDFLIGGVNPSDVSDAVTKINAITSITITTNPEEEKLRKLTAYNGILSAVNNIITINADTTKFDIASFKYRFIDKTDPENPIETIANFAGQTAITGSFFSSDVTTYVYINDSGSIVQKTTAQGGINLFDKIVLGNLNTDPTDLFFTNVAQTIQAGYGLEMTTEALLRRLGGTNLEGCVFSGNAALTLAKTSGVAIGMGRGYNVDFNIPNLQTTASESVTGTLTGFIIRAHVDATDNIISDINVSLVVDPGQYNNAGTLAVVNSSQFSIQRLFYFYGSDILLAYYGNAVYTSLENAEIGIGTELFQEHPETFEATFRGYLIIKGNATNLSDGAQAKIILPTRIRL